MGRPKSRGPYQGSASSAAMASAETAQPRRRRRSGDRTACQRPHSDGWNRVDGEGRLGQHAEAADRAEGEGPARVAEAFRAHEGVDGERHHGGQGQVELEVGEGEHHEGRSGEEKGRPHPGLRVGQPPAQAIEGGHGHGEERHHHRLRGEGRDGQDEVEQTGRAGRHRRIEGRRLEDLARTGVGNDTQAAMAIHRPLEVIGVVPLRRPPIDEHPGGGEHAQEEPQRRDGERRAARGQRLRHVEWSA